MAVPLSNCPDRRSLGSIRTFLPGLTATLRRGVLPSTPEAIEVFQKAKICYAPGKAANAGGVATSGLEMSQNSMRMAWSREEVDNKLHGIMLAIHEQCAKYGEKDGKYINYVQGANIGGFVKVADSMIEQGVV